MVTSTWRAAVALTLAWALVMAGAGVASGQASGPPAGPQTDVASYDIKVTLDAASKQLRGSERISYRNPSGDTLRELWLRLYFNAFSSAETQWMKESGGSHRGYQADQPGWTKVEELKLADGTPLSTEGGDPDQTIVRVPLLRPLGPGESLVLDLRWTAQLPRVFARTGYAGDFVMAGQWFPKLAVYDRGRWDTEPWHANSEFFADFGNYDLALTVPSGYVTGASGVRTGESENGDKTKTVRYRAERVTDVAWTAWPNFAVVQRDLDAAGQKTQVELFLPPGEQGNTDRHFAAIRAALDAYGTWYGAYPWPKLTVVVPPDEAGGAGGMEYPTLVTTGTNGVPSSESLGLDRGFHGLEMVTVHEIAHEWFPMQLQSNEAAEAWLDEGFADYLTTRVLGRLYGENASMADYPIAKFGYEESKRAELAVGGAARIPLATASWNFASTEAYAATVYSKGSLALKSLEGLLGDERLTKALHEYADRWRWRHPTSADLRDALFVSTDTPVDWFFQSFVFGRDMVDYRVASLDTALAVVERVGEAPYPVDVRLSLADGTYLDRRWDGQGEHLVLEGGGKEVTGVAIDPEERIALESDRLDNARVRAPDGTASFALAGRWLGLVQLLLQLLGQVG